MTTSISGGKTIAKSRLLPAMPNPQFCIDFQIDHDSIPRQAMLLFEIRSASKELLASRRISLHELLGKTRIDDTVLCHRGCKVYQISIISLRIVDNSILLGLNFIS